MKKLVPIVFATLILAAGCNQTGKEMSENPFFSEYSTPFQVPPFDKISNDHFLPAVQKGIEEHKAEIDDIISNSEEPSFENTLEALDNSGSLLNKVESVFDNLQSANTSDELQSIAQEITPLVSGHADDIRLNPELFMRIKSVYEQKDDLNLTVEQKALLEKKYKDFVRGGAELNTDNQTKLREINQKLSLLSLEFGNNVLAETNEFQMFIESEDDLAGLPDNVITGAAEAANEAGQEGKWLFTIQRPSMYPFLTYAENRDLREKLHTAYCQRGDNDNDRDNKKILSEIVNLRLEKANLLGYETHANFILEKNMAKDPEGVYGLIRPLWEAALPVSKLELKEMQELANREGADFKLAHWDWWYYAEKVRKEKYDLDEEEIRVYLKLENVLDGVFQVCNNLWGLQFEEIEGIPVPHEDVKAFEVKEEDGSHIGVLYMDFYPRASKRGGAWMSSYRKQQKIDGENVPPVITTVFNFSKPVGDKPALISFEQASTMFHEFGHALHGLLSDCNYFSLSGTSVSRDFVELPSQIMENWASDPEVIKMYARHYETNEPIPDELIEKMMNASYFNQGFTTIEYLSAAFLDMDWHTIKETAEFDVDQFEIQALESLGLIPEIIVRYRSTYFNHIFSGGYSAGYYSYIWSGVLDSDAFQAFKETSLFDKATAASYRENILEKGGTEDPMELYKRFRGREPSIDPLLKKRGLL
jgi:peptidyl-dipeptidase Dcp